MKTLTTLLLAAAASVSLNANASVYGDPAMGDVFPMEAVTIQTQATHNVADTGKLVWSVAYEEYVNPADFNTTSTETLAGVLSTLESNPPAAGSANNSTFVWDATADEYQLR